jgi:hypothetical protein
LDVLPDALTGFAFAAGDADFTALLRETAAPAFLTFFSAFLTPVFFPGAFLAALLFAVDFFATVFLAAAFLATDFLEVPLATDRAPLERLTGARLEPAAVVLRPPEAFLPGAFLPGAVLPEAFLPEALVEVALRMGRLEAVLGTLRTLG